MTLIDLACDVVAPLEADELVDGLLAELSRLRLENQGLRVAVASNRRIGAAIGILMGLHHLTEQQAFDLLKVASSRSHTKMRELADEVLLTGALPDAPAAAAVCTGQAGNPAGTRA